MQFSIIVISVSHIKGVKFGEKSNEREKFGKVLSARKIAFQGAYVQFVKALWCTEIKAANYLM